MLTKRIENLAYFNWSGLENTNIIGGKYKNFLICPSISTRSVNLFQDGTPFKKRRTEVRLSG